MRGLGFVAVGVAALLVGLLARGAADNTRGAFQVVGFVGFVLVVVGLALAGKALLTDD